MNPKVSIIVPVYRVEKYLERCVDSLLNQTLSEIEIILIDDASPDECPKLCDQFCEKDSRVSVIHKEINQGLAEARNTGIEYASGKYLLFVDSDDFVEQNMCDCLYERAEATKADTVLFSMDYLMENGKKVVYHTNDEKEQLFCGEQVMEEFFPEVLGAEPSHDTDYSFGMSPCTIFVKKDVLINNQIRFISERKYIYEDLTFLFLYYPWVKRVLVYPVVFYHYCMNESSLTTKKDMERFERIRVMDRYLIEQYGASILGKENVMLRYQRIMVSYIRLCIMQLPFNLQGYRKIKEITKDELTKRVLSNYPIQKLPIKQRVFAYLLKYRCVFLNLLLTVVYRKIR